MNKLKTAGRRRIWAVVVLLGLLSGPAWVHAQSAVEITPLPDVEVVVTPLEDEPAASSPPLAAPPPPARDATPAWFWWSVLPLLLVVAGSLLPWAGRERLRRRVLPIVLLAHVALLLVWWGYRHSTAVSASEASAGVGSPG